MWCFTVLGLMLENAPYLRVLPARRDQLQNLDLAIRQGGTEVRCAAVRSVLDRAGSYALEQMAGDP